MILAADLVLPVLSPPLRDGAVRLEGGRIAEVGAAAELERLHPGEEVRRFPGCALLPGLVNLHSHLEYAALGPLPAPTPFLEWLPDLVRRSRVMTGPEWLASARLGARRTLEAGITACADITRSGGGAAAMAEAGLRGVCCAEWVAVGDETLEQEWGGFRARFSEVRRISRDALFLPGISPHSPYTLSAAALRRVSALAEEERAFLAIHASETAAEAALVGTGSGPFAERFSPMFGLAFPAGATSVSYLQGLGLVGSRTLLAHGVHLAAGDLDILRAQGAALALCPTSNRMLEAGEPPDPMELEKRGIRWGVGTDSLASVPALDLWAEARFLRGRYGVPAERLLRALTLDAARILGMRKVGALAPGWAADLAVFPVQGEVADEEAVLAGAGAQAREVLLRGRSCFINVKAADPND